MARCVMRCIGVYRMELQACVGSYLKSYDPEADGVLGVWTADIAQARVFDSLEDLTTCWRQVRQREPVRADGLPNRPLTAFTVEIIYLERNAP